MQCSNCNKSLKFISIGICSYIRETESVKKFLPTNFVDYFHLLYCSNLYLSVTTDNLIGLIDISFYSKSIGS